ncbi:sugar phosphate isomerase/epimerase, partial [bacterium]|nr:sugar phosphate isomerase/epimerase [bacterium]
MKVGCAFLYTITSYGFPPSFADNLKAMEEIREMGFKAAELEIDVDANLQEYLDGKDRVKSKLKELNLTVNNVICVLQQGFSMDRQAADETAKRFEKLAELVADWGSEFVAVCAYMPKEIQMIKGTEIYRGSPATRVVVPGDFVWKDFWSNIVERFSALAKIAGSKGLKLIVENRVGDFIHSSDGYLRLFDDSGAENAGMLLDIAHINATKEHLGLILPKFDKRLMFVHLADNDGATSAHIPFGKGNVDFKAIIESLKKIGYDGWLN